MKFKCFECGDEHKARTDKFPQTILDKKTMTIVGYLCRKCVKKDLVSKRPDGVGWRKAFRDFIKNIKNPIIQGA